MKLQGDETCTIRQRTTGICRLQIDLGTGSSVRDLCYASTFTAILFAPVVADQLDFGFKGAKGVIVRKAT